MYQYFLVHLLDDGKTKPTPKPDNRKTKKKGKVTKPSSEPTPTVDPDFMCLIRANYRAEKISTVVSFEEIIRKSVLIEIVKIFLWALSRTTVS